MQESAHSTMSNMPEMLPEAIVAAIREFISEQKSILNTEQLSDLPIGQNVFKLIYPHCDLLFYPIIDIDEKNNGCLIPHLPLKSGKECNVIFINTYQTAEKQVFTAAHEFGHYLEVDKVVKKQHPGTDAERIINRFAAEWLMPEEQFKKKLHDLLESRRLINNIALKDMLEVAVECMDAFTVPYNAVIIRMVEVGFLDYSSGSMLVDGDDRIPLNTLEKMRNNMISGRENSVLQTRSLRKAFVGLSDYLTRENVADNLAPIKLQRVQEWFDLLGQEQSIGLDKKITLKDNNV